MKRKEWLLVLALCLLAGGYALVMGIRTAVPTADYDVKTAAAELTAQCFASIRQRKEELGILPSPANDVNDTGMIGQDFSYITTTLGELEAKRTTTNPNMAAVVVDMFNELGLQPGDEIAVNCSGSFPAMNIAVLCAAEVMGLSPPLLPPLAPPPTEPTTRILPTWIWSITFGRRDFSPTRAAASPSEASRTKERKCLTR